MVTELAKRGIEVGGSDGINIWIPVADEQSAMVALASRGIGVAPGRPFAANGLAPHIRVTTGLVDGNAAPIADEIAAAAHAQGSPTR
jgi:hypothetical protein